VRNRSRGFLGGTRVVFLTIALAILASPYAAAQVSGATLSGTVSDSSGAVLANVQISIKNEETGEVRSLTVDSAGLYSAPNLLPGKYDVTATAAGFRPRYRRASR